MAPTSLRIKSQHPPVVGEPARAGPLPTLQIRPLAFLWPVWPPEHFQSTANEFTFRASAFAIFPAWITSMLPAKYHLLLEAFWDLCLVWFSPQTLSPPWHINITRLLSCLSASLSLQENISSTKEGSTLPPSVSPCLERYPAHSGCFGVRKCENNIPLRPAQPCSPLLSQESQHSPSAADTVLVCPPPSLGPGGATC